MPEVNQQISQTPPTPKGINWKTVLIGALIGGLVVGIGALGFYLYQGQEKETTSTESAKQATPSVNKNDNNNVVRDEVWEALEQQEKISVIISLNGPTLTEYNEDLEAYKSNIKIVQDRVLSLLSPEDFDLVYQYEAVPGLAGHITKKGLEAIKDSKDVMTVSPNRTVKINQGM